MISSREVGESSKLIKIFTREIGLINAYAQGIRELRSKLRYSLQDLSYVSISLVRGKNIWRISGTYQVLTLPLIKAEGDRLRILSRILKLMLRLVGFDDKNKELFDELRDAICFLGKEELNSRDLRNFEIIVVLKILYHLGYLGDSNSFGVGTTELNQFIILPLRDKELLRNMEEFRGVCVSVINESLKHTQL